jgi:hypothetical protein
MKKEKFCFYFYNTFSCKSIFENFIIEGLSQQDQLNIFFAISVMSISPQ